MWAEAGSLQGGMNHGAPERGQRRTEELRDGESTAPEDVQAVWKRPSPREGQASSRAGRQFCGRLTRAGKTEPASLSFPVRRAPPSGRVRFHECFVILHTDYGRKWASLERRASEQGPSSPVRAVKQARQASRAWPPGLTAAPGRGAPPSAYPALVARTGRRTQLQV